MINAFRATGALKSEMRLAMFFDRNCEGVAFIRVA